jgi:hypothetical protein
MSQVCRPVPPWYIHARQFASSTNLELDKEWNSKEMIEARQPVHAPGSEAWDHPRLEGILEFFEKLASMFKISGDMPFICQSALNWHAAQYFLYAREHGQIKYLRDLWTDHLYQGIGDPTPPKPTRSGRKCRRQSTEGFRESHLCPKSW